MSSLSTMASLCLSEGVGVACILSGRSHTLCSVIAVASGHSISLARCGFAVGSSISEILIVGAVEERAGWWMDPDSLIPLSRRTSKWRR